MTAELTIKELGTIIKWWNIVRASEYDLAGERALADKITRISSEMYKEAKATADLNKRIKESVLGARP